MRPVAISFPRAVQHFAIGADGPHYFDFHWPQRHWIVLHGTAGGNSAQEIAQYFTQTPHSTHYVIDRDGTVVQCVPEEASAWGNAPVEPGADIWWNQFPNPNWVTFSIEHVKPDAQNQTPLTSAQAQASFALIAHLCDTYGIPKRAADAQGGICGHVSIDPQSRHNCPGPYPWVGLWAALQTGGTPPMPQLPNGYTDANSVITAPNGHTIVRTIRDEFLKNPDFFGMPLDDEHAISATNTEQTFEQRIVGMQMHADATWTFLPGVPAGYRVIEQRQLLDARDAQIAQLQQQVNTTTSAILTTQQQADLAAIQALRLALQAH